MKGCKIKQMSWFYGAEKCLSADSTCSVLFYLNRRLFYKTNVITLYSKICISFLNVCLCGGYKSISQRGWRQDYISGYYNSIADDFNEFDFCWSYRNKIIPLLKGFFQWIDFALVRELNTFLSFWPETRPGFAALTEFRITVLSSFEVEIQRQTQGISSLKWNREKSLHDILEKQNGFVSNSSGHNIFIVW